MIPVRILGTGSVRPGRAVSNEEVCATVIPPRDPARVWEKTGIRTRYWKNPEDSMVSMGAQAVRAALDLAGLEAPVIQRVIFVCSNGGDYISPPTSSVLAAELGIARQADAMDVNNACMGFLTGLDLGARAVATGSGVVAVVTVEVVSDAIVPEEHRAYLIMGDAATAVLLGPAESDEGVLGIRLGNDGSLSGSLLHAHPRHTGVWGPLRFGMNAGDIHELVVRLMSDSAANALEQAGCSIDEMDWVLPHQPNGRLLEGIVEAVGANADQLVPIVEHVGSIAAASIPMSLDVLMRTRPVKAGQRVLLVGVGAGVSYGAVVLRLGALPARIREA
ncbi:MAG: ketoacyl-ACP synthase III [Proteobacteria bacterium]|nr:ketoacyl-ACP synthase III [Pseudomonadota bacterium]